MRHQSTPWILLLCLATPVTAAADSSTFRITAIIEKRQVSADGRYAVVGEALRRQETSSADGRHALKSTAAILHPERR